VTSSSQTDVLPFVVYLLGIPLAQVLSWSVISAQPDFPYLLAHSCVALVITLPFLLWRESKQQTRIATRIAFHAIPLYGYCIIAVLLRRPSSDPKGEALGMIFGGSILLAVLGALAAGVVAVIVGALLRARTSDVA